MTRARLGSRVPRTGIQEEGLRSRGMAVTEGLVSQDDTGEYVGKMRTSTVLPSLTEVA